MKKELGGVCGAKERPGLTPTLREAPCSLGTALSSSVVTWAHCEPAPLRWSPALLLDQCLFSGTYGNLFDSQCTQLQSDDSKTYRAFYSV